jgi:acetyl esterase/lipase
MAAVITLMAKERRGPRIRFQVLLYPVVDYRTNNASYRKFADGPWLTARSMQWMFDLQGFKGDEKPLPPLTCDGGSVSLHASLLELEHASNDGHVSRRALAAFDRVREPPEGSEARAEERALGEFRVEGQVVRIHRPPEERPAAMEEHVAEVSRRVAEPTAPVDDPGETTGR